jgi:hypothetical protein
MMLTKIKAFLRKYKRQVIVVTSIVTVLVLSLATYLIVHAVSYNKLQEQNLALATKYTAVSMHSSEAIEAFLAVTVPDDGKVYIYTQNFAAELRDVEALRNETTLLNLDAKCDANVFCQGLDYDSKQESIDKNEKIMNYFHEMQILQERAEYQMPPSTASAFIHGGISGLNIAQHTTHFNNQTDMKNKAVAINEKYGSEIIADHYNGFITMLDNNIAYMSGQIANMQEFHDKFSSAKSVNSYRNNADYKRVSASFRDNVNNIVANKRWVSSVNSTYALVQAKYNESNQ